MTVARSDDLFTPLPVKPTAEERLAELNLSLSPEIDYDIESMFPKTDGWGWKTEIKRKVKLIQQIEPELRDCLHEGERVLYVAKGVRYSFMEFYFMGLWASMINHTQFVLTNLRLVMIHCNSRGKAKRTFWMLYYSQIEKFKGTWNGMLNLKLKDGKKLSFSGFSKSDRKEMPAIFQKALDRYRASGFNPASSQSLENLCSYCKDQVPVQTHTCDNCGATYWTPFQLAWRSFIFPSWGDFLMGHTSIAVLEMFGGIITWTTLLIGIKRWAETGNTLPLVLTFIAFVIAHGVDAIITVRIAKKGLHPKNLPEPA
ncbi:hypothetical protein [Rubinisphaera margarita]|uniref:hypothetical protein n=1 Tax=Rubinisphaera margarita TaxID=2909586 RepID=UPI001EE8273E|nr:hypothetical protein [Rubinisphaera margarita]MCG6156642.1 hypothetical protein [Rubinisphaera margarita]